MAKLTREDVERIIEEAREKGEKADLFRTNLSKAKLSGMDLSGVNLNGAYLGGVNLSKANLSRTDLCWTNLRRADLRWANFNKAIVWGTIFAKVGLSKVKGLDTVRHRGPSHIDTHTLQRSRGKIPEVFLRGCGLSDVQIEIARLHNPNLTSEQITTITYKIHELRIDNPIQYYSCFISYSSKDEAFAQRLHADLQQKGVRCWFAPEDMKIGDKIRPTIDQSIRVHDKLLIILSENSLNSEWVESEVEKAFEEERKRKQTVLFPVRLDEAVMETEESWAAEIRRTRHIGDFTRWKDHDWYQQAFERLVWDLKAEG